MINITGSKISLRIDDLLYSGGLRSYLGNFVGEAIDYISLAHECEETENYQGSVINYSKALQSNSQ